MSDARQHLVDRTRFVFGTPPVESVTVVALLLAATTGVVALGATPVGVVSGIAVIAVPAAVAVALTGPLLRARGGTFALNRSALLAVVMAAVVATFVIAAVAVRSFLGTGPAVVVEATLMAAAGTFAFRLLVLVAVTGPPLRRRAVPAAVQPVATVVVVVVAAGAVGLPVVTGAGLFVTLLATALYAGIVAGLVTIVDHSFNRDLGIGGFDFLHRFLEHVAGRHRGLESLFRSLGEPATLPVSVLAIRDADGATKARVVAPLAHPGPFPDVGGGTLPYRLAAAGDGVVFTPHGLAGHAYNPASSRDVDAICEAVATADRAVDATTTATPPVRERVDGATVTGQRFGDGTLLVSSFAPAATDDVSGAVGREAIEAAGVGGAPVVVDAHNARPTEGVTDGLTTPGSRRADALVQAVERAATRLDGASTGRLRAGVAVDATPYGVEDGIGPLGVRVLATEVAGETAVYVIVDGNNMLPSVREAIHRAVDEAVPTVDVLTVATTDTHAVNHLDWTNYVGRSLDGTVLAERIARTVAEAVDDLEPVRAGTATATADVTVLGEGTVDRIARLTDRILPICGAFVLVSTLLVTGVAVGLFWLVSP